MINFGLFSTIILLGEILLLREATGKSDWQPGTGRKDLSCCLSSSVGLGYLLQAVSLHDQNFKTCMAFHGSMVVIEIKVENY